MKSFGAALFLCGMIAEWMEVLSGRPQPTRILGLAAVLAVSGCLSSCDGSNTGPAAVMAPKYKATQLGPSLPLVVGNGINNSGQVTGYFLTPEGDRHPFLYSNGMMTDLCTSVCKSGEGQAINDAGQVTGVADGHAFLYSNGTMIDLGTLGGSQSTGYGINNSGQVVGQSLTAESSPENNVKQAFIYSGGPMVALGTLGGTYSLAYGISDNGQITGRASTTGNADYHAFLNSGGTMIDLGTPGSASTGYGINDAGQITGAADLPDLHAFLYSNGTMIELGSLPGSQSTGYGIIGYGINKRGQVVGYGSLPTGNGAFLYSKSEVFDLTALVNEGPGSPVVAIGKGINDSGQIVAYTCSGIAQLPECWTWRLDPIP